MHIFFSGIGGTGIGPLALIAKQAGYEVSGSDKQSSQYVDYLRKKGIENIHIGQSYGQIRDIHQKHPIDWYVYSSAILIEKPDAPELKFCHEQQVKATKRDALLNQLLDDKKLKMIAVAGTHGKTTTTAMAIWLFKELGMPISYSVGAKIPFGDMGQYQENSEFFVYECDEFDRNFLAFKPYISVITGVGWDHHEIFPTREDYQIAFREFISQSSHTFMWQKDFDYLKLAPHPSISIMRETDNTQDLRLKGLYNRLDARLAVEAVRRTTNTPAPKLLEAINRFPGLQRRMEQIIPNLYSDYAHTPEKIRGAISTAIEMAFEKNQEVVVIYEPLTNRRQHYMMHDYKDCFDGAKKVYWLPSYLAREDSAQRIIPPEELISHLADPAIAEAYARDDSLKQTIENHLKNGDLVVAMAGGGGDSLDEWLRGMFKG